MWSRCSWVRHGVIVLGIALVTGGLGQTLERLPEDLTFPRGKTSPGSVTFSHLTHVNQKRTDCTICHPSLFKILGEGSPADEVAIGHPKCEVCHNARDAFGLNNCTACHRGQ